MVSVQVLDGFKVINNIDALHRLFPIGVTGKPRAPEQPRLTGTRLIFDIRI